MPPMTQALIVINVLAFGAQQLWGDAMLQWLALWPVSSDLFMPWQLASYAFLHGGLTHLVFNMFGLWMFGSDLERVWGPRRMAAFFAVSVVVAGAAQLLVTQLLGSDVPTVGASGGLFGLLIGFSMVFPTRKVIPLLLPIPMPAPIFVALYGAIELSLGVTGNASGVAHFAHLGGLLGGWLVTRYWRGQAPFARRFG